MTAVPTSAGRCAVCGAALPKAAAFTGCPRCILGLGSSAALAAKVDSTLREFGDYELLEEIARGGMGVVFRARQRSLRREVAVKLMIGGELSGEAARRMFATEARAAAALHHSNIVAVYESGERELQPFIAMRFVPGGRNIAQWAAPQRAAQAWRELAGATAKVARAVAHAHERGVLHRDLKPANILWDDAEGPQVTDFGLAKLAAADGGLTISAQMLGSPGYMAPEQTGTRAEEMTTLTDVYGLGAVLYDLLCGAPPFHGKSALDTVRRVAEEPPVRPSAVTRGVDADLETICLKCLEKSPSARYASARELAEELERYQRGEPILARPVGAAKRLWRWCRRKPAFAALLAVILAAGIAGGAAVFWQWRKAEAARALQAQAIEETRTANAAQAEALNHLRWQEMDHLLERGETASALAHAAQFIRRQPQNWQAAMYAMSIVDQHAFPVLAAPEISGPMLEIPAQLSADGKWIVHVNADHKIHVVEAATGWEVAAFAQTGRVDLTKPATLLDNLRGTPVQVVAIASGPGSWPLAVSTADGQLTLRTLPKGEAVPLEGASTSGMAGMAYAANGSRFLARTEHTVRVWSLADVAAEPVKLVLEGGVTGAAISADGSVVFGWNRTRAAVWEMPSGQVLARMECRKIFSHGALSADGRRAALTEPGAETRIWDVASARELRAIAGPPVMELYPLLNADGTRLVTGAHGRELTVTDTASGLRVSPPMHTHKLAGDADAPRVPWMVASPDGRVVASTGLEQAVGVWDASTGVALRAPAFAGTGGGSVPWVQLSADGANTLVQVPTTDRETSVMLWKSTAVRTPRRGPAEDGLISGNVISPDGKYFAWGVFSTALPQVHRYRVMEIASQKMVLDVAVDGPPSVPMFSPDGRITYCAVNSPGAGFFMAWNLATGEQLWKSASQPDGCGVAALSPDGALIVAACNRSEREGIFVVLDAASGAVLRSDAVADAVTNIRFAPDNSGRVLTAGLSKTARLWRARTAETLQTFSEKRDVFSAAAAWSADATLLATAGSEGVSVWDPATGRAVSPVLPHRAWLSHLEFNPDGRVLATVSRDGSLRLWNPRTGQPLCPPRQQGASCDTIRFAPDGATFLVRDAGGFRFWDTERAEPVTARFPSSTPSIGTTDCVSHRAILSPNGTQVAGGTGNQVALWTVSRPTGTVPEWFPELLEVIAQMRLDENGTATFVPGREILRVQERISGAPADEPFARWARRVLGIEGR